MRFIQTAVDRGAPAFAIAECPAPAAGPDEAVISVRCFGLNRADLLQARGNLDPSPLRLRVFPGDGKAEARSLDAAVDRRGSLVERIEDARAIRGRDAAPLVDDVEHRESVAHAERELDRRVARRILDCIRQQVVDDRAQPLGVAGHRGGRELRIERDHARERGEPLLADDAADDVGHCDRTEGRGFHRARLVICEEVLDQLLQAERVVANDAHDVVLLGRKLPADAVAQQLGALAHRRERRLELVRDVTQEARLLLLEIGKAAPQPFEALADVAQILRAGDLDRVAEIRAAHTADREIELANRAASYELAMGALYWKFKSRCYFEYRDLQLLSSR